MTVKELIKQLQNYSKNAEVTMADGLPVVAVHYINDKVIITDQLETNEEDYYDPDKTTNSTT